MNIVRTLSEQGYWDLMKRKVTYPAHLKPYLEEVFFALSNKELSAQGVAKIILYAVYRVDKRGLPMMKDVMLYIPLLIQQIVIPDDIQAQKEAVDFVNFHAESLKKAREWSETTNWLFAKELFDTVFELLRPVLEATDDPTEAWLEYLACNAATEVARWREHRAILETLRR